MNGTGLKINQYKTSYQFLADDIITAFPDSATEVTTNRLRKLFYYTNPEICAAEKLEKPSFGVKFIDALLEYVKAEEDRGQEKDVEKASSAKRKRWPLITGIIGSAVIGLAVLLWLNRPVYWEEPFDDVSYEGLKKRGFEVLHYDSAAFAQQPQKGCLTLYTYPGDYWVKKERGEKPYIKNLVVRRIGAKECVITARIANYFNPFQHHQQAGLFLLNAKCEPENSLRMTYVYATTGNGEKSIKWSDHKYTDRTQNFALVFLQNGKPLEAFNYETYPEFQDIKEVEDIMIRINGRKIVIITRSGTSWGAARLEKKQELVLPFTPAYVGLAAFQGMTDEKGRPLKADTIPASFEFLKIEPLK